MPQNQLSTSKTVVFAILLPVICPGKDDTLGHLRRFANSLVRTSQTRSQRNDGIRFRLVVYLDVCCVDDTLVAPGITGDHSVKTVEDVLLQDKVPEVITVVRDQFLGSSSKIWDHCAKKAFKDGCDFLALMRHDAELSNTGWMDTAYAHFEKFAASSGAPFGFGCVALCNNNGLPTFPIVHRTHMEVFKKGILPDIFIDEGPEYLFQLYRRFGCSSILPRQVVQGVTANPFDPTAKDWTFETLDWATANAEAWLQDRGCKCERVLTLDVVIPSFRVTIPFLRRIIELKYSKSCSVMYFIIIDNPDSPHILELQALYSNRPDVRIRVNEANLGTSASRNRGINESAAEWIHFMDDDIIPRENVFFNVEKHLRAHPNAAGLIGVTDFPPADTIWKAALHISSAVHYFSVAETLPSDVPWGVSANLVARRNIRDGVRFKTIYPKTGGGEDIDYCLSKRAASKARGGEGFAPAPDIRLVHPWWPGGRRAYWRFYVWSHGDELLSSQFPQYTYLDYAPNSAESFLLCLLCFSIATVAAHWKFAIIALKAAFCTILSNTLHFCFRHLVLHPERVPKIETNIRGIRWIVAVVESSFIRFFREIGWFHGMVDHGGYNFFRRFDLNGGRLGNTLINEERNFRLQKIAFSVLCTLALVFY